MYLNLYSLKYGILVISILKNSKNLQQFQKFERMHY